MTPRKVILSGDVATDLGTLAQALNYGEEILPFTAIGSTEQVAAGTPVQFGGFAVDRAIFRRLLGQDFRWLVYAAGWANPADGNNLTISLVYTDDTTATTALGHITYNGAGWLKKTLGPFDLFATPGVVNTEQIPIVQLKASKAGGANGLLSAWTVWLRIVPPNV